MEDHSFSEPDFKVLIDAVQAPSFVPDDQMQELIEKLADLGGPHKAKILKENVGCFNTKKHSNEDVCSKQSILWKKLCIREERLFSGTSIRASAER